MARVLAVGGAHVDRKAWLAAPHVPGASNPGTWEIDPGGGAFNAARNLSRLGHDVTLVAPRGGDAGGDLVTRAAADAGVEDCPITFLDRATPSYTAILEPDGNLVTGVADMALYDLMPPRRLMSARFCARLAKVDLVLCDANLPAPTLLALATAARKLAVPVAAIAISRAKVARLRPALGLIDVLCMNLAESTSLLGFATDEPVDERLKAAGLSGAVISNGADAVTAYIAAGTAFQLLPPPIARLSDVTGAGDALASGFLDGLLRGLPLGACVLYGIACAELTARVRGAVRGDLSPHLLAQTAQTMARDSLPAPT